MNTNSGKQKKNNNQPKPLLVKKTTLQINTNIPIEPPNLSKIQSPTNKPLSISDHIDNQHKNINNNLNNKQQTRGQTPESQNHLANSKKLTKKAYQKEPLPSPKVQGLQKTISNTVTGGFTSPKGAQIRDKIVFSFGSQKVLANKQQKQKKQQRDQKMFKIEQLEKAIQQSKIKESQFVSKQSQLQITNEKLKQQNQQLKKKLNQLEKKIEKIIESNNQTKKMLRQRIHSYNQQGGQLQTLRNQIKTLQERVQKLLVQNQDLKTQINKFSDYNLKDSLIQNHSQVSNIRQVQLRGSRVSQMYLKQSDEQSLLQFNNIENAEDNLDLQSYISEAEQSYLEQYKNNVEIFDKIKNEYEQILKDIDIRYKKLAEDYSATILQQTKQIYDLEYKHDQLYSELYNDHKTQKIHLSVDLDSIILKNHQHIASLNIKMHNLKEQNKELLEKLQQHRTHNKFLEAQIDIQRMKKKFINENDKFQYNVVKLNLLTIIDKLKMQIDKEKRRYNVIYNRLVANRSGVTQNK